MHKNIHDVLQDFKIQKQQKLKVPKQISHIDFLIEITLKLLYPENTLHTPMSVVLNNTSAISSLVLEGSLTRTYTRKDYQRLQAAQEEKEQKILKTKVTTLTEKILRKKVPKEARW